MMAADAIADAANVKAEMAGDNPKPETLNPGIVRGGPLVHFSQTAHVELKSGHVYQPGAYTRPLLGTTLYMFLWDMLVGETAQVELKSGRV